MKEITKQTLKEIQSRFATSNGYILSVENPIYCPQVNGLTNVCLTELGFSSLSQKNLENFLVSSAYKADSNLFYREVSEDGKILTPAINVCKNASVALAFGVNQCYQRANMIMNALERSPVNLISQGLFGREYNPETNKVNSMVLTQSNLWSALAYISAGRIEKSRQIMRNLERVRYDAQVGFFNSQDCRDNSSHPRFFIDDQALAILTYLKMGEKNKAKELTESVIKSLFYDPSSGLFNSSFYGLEVDRTKSTYKNSLMAFALGSMGYDCELKNVQKGLIRELYDSKERLFKQSTRDSTLVPDNSALALVALEYDSIQHAIF
ncbi:MAG: hypothetical protein WCK90_03015 [archaeon]